MFNKIFSENRAFYEIMLKNTVQPDKRVLFNDASTAKFTRCC